MTVSMRVMSAGDGYQYLLKSIATGDVHRDASVPLTRYYTAAGTPPGRWLGTGLAALADGQISAGDQVSEDHLKLLLGQGRDPITGVALGRAYPEYVPVAQRIAERIDGLDPGMGPAARTAAIDQIAAEEKDRGCRRAVAGYDFTFSIPKSASILWALADAPTQKLIANAHHAAIADVVAFMEEQIAATRIGATGPDGAVVQVEVTGLIATAFDHFDSRAGDPHLHTHVVISNKVQTVHDGKWRSLDGRPLHAATVTLSQLHEAFFADRITAELGIDWETRPMGRDRNPAWAITTVPAELIAAFSGRSRDIDNATEGLIEDYREAHRRMPSRAAIIKLRAQATLMTRPPKQLHSLADLTATWRERATNLLGGDATSWARHATRHRGGQLLRATDIPAETIAELGRKVVEVVGEKRSTWRRWNLHAEASRQSMGYRFATPTDRLTIVAQITDAAERASIRLTPPNLAPIPTQFRRADGTSRFRPRHSTLYTSKQLLDAEDHLLALARTKTAPRLDAATITKASEHRDAQGRRLSSDQATALTVITTSGRTLDVLIGPAGAGKTTTLASLRTAWENEHGPGSVVGLAPSAVAAEVLAAELGIPAENTAKWWYDHAALGVTFEPGQLVIIDEASLAGTLSLDHIATHANECGAKVLLVGDDAQLPAVDSGGAFALLVNDRKDAPQLTDIHRFTNAWEKTASLALRGGHAEVIDTYIGHGRVHAGTTDDMTEAAYAAWRTDTRAGLTSVLIAPTRETVTELNALARADLILEGTINPDSEITIAGGLSASVGDRVITRRNDRRLHAGRHWVRNGDHWIITALHPDGSATVRPNDPSRRAGLVLPADYVAEDLDLGYAITTHRAQGITTDTAHALINVATARENLYVAMTRGRRSNTAYVATDHPDPLHAGPRTQVTARTVLRAVLDRSGAEPSAHQAAANEQDRATSIAQLAAEYETLAQAAQHERWANLVRASGLTDDQAQSVIDSDAFGALCTQLRRAEAFHHNVNRLLPRLVTARGVGDTDDIATALHARLSRATARLTGSGRNRKPPRLIAGLIPEAVGPVHPEMRVALNARRELIEQLVGAHLDQALAINEPWLDAIGKASHPTDQRHSARWRSAALVVVAYRERYGITDRASALGSRPRTTAQEADYVIAGRAPAQLRSLVDRPQPPVQTATHERKL